MLFDVNRKLNLFRCRIGKIPEAVATEVINKKQKFPLPNAWTSLGEPTALNRKVMGTFIHLNVSSEINM